MKTSYKMISADKQNLVKDERGFPCKYALIIKNALAVASACASVRK
jgi:hypothetical protein